MSPVIIQMKEAITNLTKEENSMLQAMIDRHQVEPALASRIHKYYRELRRVNVNAGQNLEMGLIMRTAFVVAEQSQPVYNMQGQAMGAVCMWANRMLGSRENTRDLLAGVKLYLSGIKAHEYELRDNLVSLQEQLNFGLGYMIKFQKAIAYFNFVELVGEAHKYLSIFKSFAWLLFLYMHRQIPTQNSFETDYLLIGVLYIMVRYGYDYVRPKLAPSLNSNKSVITNILNQLFQIFQIDHPQVFKEVTGKVDGYFQELMASGVLRCGNYKGNDFLGPELIGWNYKKIDLAYQKGSSPHQIDFRLVLEDRLTNLTPARQNHITPRAEVQKDGAKRQEKKKNKSFASHKIINFDEEQTSTISAGHKQTFDPIKLPSNIRVSPSYNRTPLICMRKPSPVTSSIQQFMNKTVKINKHGLQLLDNQKEIIEVIRSTISRESASSSRVKEKVLLTYNYFLAIVSQYLNQEEYDEQDYNGIHCSCLLHSLLLILAADSSPEDIDGFAREQSVKIRQEIAVSGYQIWLVCRFFKKKQERMPPVVRQINAALNNLVISRLIWEEESCFQIQKYSSQFQYVSVRSHNMQILIEDILNYSKTCILNLCSSFSFENGSAALEQTFFVNLKYLIINCSSILCWRNLHQMILSLAYLLFRKHGMNSSFNDIIVHYQRGNKIESSELKKVVSQIWMLDENQVEKNVDIIKFYNKIFLPFVQEYMKNISEDFFCDFISPFQTSIHEKSKSQPFSSRRVTSNPKVRVQNVSHSFYDELRHSKTQVDEGSSQVMKNKEMGERQPLRDHTRQRERPSLGAILGNETMKGKNARLSN